MDAFGVIEAIRGGDRDRRIPILVLTTESGADLKRRARDSGATGWIVKPFDSSALVGAIRRVTGS
jgi:two-component system chemotaxis response regulator CheY